jgi:hypothetical protein
MDAFTSVIQFSILMTSISLMFDFVQEEGYILNRYADFMLRYVHDKLGWFGIWIYKVTGGCVYCTNPYISAVFFYLFFGFSSIELMALFIAAIGLNNTLIQLAYGILNACYKR